MIGSRVPPIGLRPPPVESYISRIRWLQVKNVAATDAPPGGVARVTGSDDEGAPEIDRPDETGQAGLLVVHPDFGIPAGAYGWATYDEWVPAKYDSADGTPAVGEGWGSEADSWILHKDRTGFRVVGEPLTAPVQVEVAREGSAGGGGPATLSIWYWDGAAETDTTDNVTVHDWLLASGQSIASGTQVAAAWDARSSRYYVTGASC